MVPFLSGTWDVLRGFFSVPLWQNFAASVAAVGIGVPVGLYIDRRKQNSSGALKKEQLLRLLDKTVLDNIVRVAGIAKEGISIPCHPDLTILDATATLKYEVLDDFSLSQEIDSLRYHLTSINYAFTVFYNVGAQQLVAVDKAQIEAINKGVAYLKKDMQETVIAAFLKEAEAVRAKIDKLLSRT